MLFRIEVPEVRSTLISLIPPSIFSSLLISMTTNFSHTANVGRVEEMNWPNLRRQQTVLCCTGMDHHHRRSRSGYTSVFLPQQVVWVGEALQQQTEHVADGGDSGLGQRGVSQGEQQSWDELKLSQEFSIFSRLTIRHSQQNTQ